MQRQLAIAACCCQSSDSIYRGVLGLLAYSLLVLAPRQ
jgi:hypothetical protein